MIGHQALFKMGRVYQGAWINIGTTEQTKMIHPQPSMAPQISKYKVIPSRI
jgi:hypothetical protein